MVGRLGSAHRRFRVPDRLVEAAQIGEHVREVRSRERRLDTRRAETLEAKVAFEGDVALQQGRGFIELASHRARQAKKRRGDHLGRRLAERSRDGQRLLAESDGSGIVARAHALDHHECGDPGQPALIAERPRQCLRLAEMVPHALRLPEWDERVPQVDVEVGTQLVRGPGLGQMAQGLEGALQVADRLPIGGRAIARRPVCRR
jgi:hypothetical protein